MESPRGTIRHATVAAYDISTGVSNDQRGWIGATLLDDEGRIGPWAREMRETVNSDRDFAIFLLDYYRENFTYSNTTSYPDQSSTDALDSFFFEGREGYCSFFAQSMATALRAAGIPAHVVTGYLGGKWNDFGGYWMVRNNMAHAWVEVYFEEGGWHRLDPTGTIAPGLNGGVLFSGSGEEETALLEEDNGNAPSFFSRAGLWADSLNTNITRSIMQFGGSSKGSFKSRITGMDFETLLWILGGLMMSVVVVSGTTSAVRRYGYFSSNLGLKLEARFVDILLQAKQPRMKSEGLIAYADRVAKSLSSDLALPFHHIATRISRWRFGASTPTPEDIRNINADISSLRKKMRKVISDNKRLGMMDNHQH